MSASTMAHSGQGSGGSESSTDLGSSVNSTTVTNLLESSFFKEQRAPALPSPAEIRALNEKTGHLRAADFDSPVPVSIPSLGLLVKYGSDVTWAEVETQISVHELLRSHQVPIPEVFGYAEDGGQRFLYMAMMEGVTLQERFARLTETERRAVCAELRVMVDTWRSVMKQDQANLYIGNEHSFSSSALFSLPPGASSKPSQTGSVGKRPLNDFLFDEVPDEAGPFLGPDAVRDFHKACELEISSPEPVVFTHDDLCPPNILISQGPNPRVTAIIDFGQSGWYPWYWEYCKAMQVGRIDRGVFDDAHREEWATHYVPLIMDPVDDEMYYSPWLNCMFSRLW